MKMGKSKGGGKTHVPNVKPGKPTDGKIEGFKYGTGSKSERACVYGADMTKRKKSV